MSKKSKNTKEEIKEQKQEENQNTQEQEETTQNNKNTQTTQESDCCEELSREKDKFLRAYADFENMKKRLEREKANAVAFANETFAKDLLTVIDSFESALMSMEQIEGDEAVNKIKEGLTLTYEQLTKVLKKHGVEEVASEGVFDPNFHQVVHQVDSDEHESGEIVNVLQKGYQLKDRLLRPAMVATKK